MLLEVTWNGLDQVSPWASESVSHCWPWKLGVEVDEMTPKAVPVLFGFQSHSVNFLGRPFESGQSFRHPKEGRTISS